MEIHEMVRDLIAKRANVWESAKAHLDERSDNGVFSVAEDAEQYQRMNSEIQAFDERIAELIQTDKANKQSDAYREEYEKYVPQETRQESQNAEERALRELLEGKRKHVDLDFRNVRVTPASDERAWQVRDLTKITGAAGGDTVPTSFVRTLYEHMVENAAIRQTNVRVVTTNSGENLEFPKTLTFGTAAIVGEGSALAEADATFDKITLGSWKYGQLAQVSSELLTDTGVSLTEFLARDLGRALGNVSGAAFVTGSGTNAPNGFITATKAQVGTSVQGTDTVITGDNLIDLHYAVIDAYARNGYWMMKRATEGAIRKIKDTNNQYLWQPGLQVGSPNLLLGRPIVTDPNMAGVGSANASVSFGDMSAYVIRDVAGVRIERSDEFAFSSDLVTWRAILRTDGDLLDGTGAIKLLDTD